jgi:hypothetical protein
VRRGTRVGAAHVAVTADGSGINEEIVDSVDDAAPGVEKAGKKAGKNYGKSMGKELEAALDRFSERISQEFGRRMEEQSDRFGERLEKSMKRSAKRIGDHLSKSLSVSLRDAMDDTLEQFGRMLDTMESRTPAVSGNGSGSGGGGGSRGGTSMFPGPDPNDRFWQMTLRMNRQFDERMEKSRAALVAKSLAQSEGMEKSRAAFVAKFLAERERMYVRSASVVERTEAALVKSQQRLYDSLSAEHQKNQALREKMEQANAAIAAKFVLARERMHDKSNQTVLASDAKLVQEQEKLFASLAREAEKRDAAMWKVRNDSAKAHYKYLADLEKGAIDERGNRVKVQGDQGGGLGDMVGGLFGAGSRNNALNLLGKSIGNIVNLTEKGTKFAQGFANGFTQAAEGAGLVQKVMSGFKGGGAASGISAAFARIAASGPAAAGALLAVLVVMSAMVSVAGALLGILTAMAAAITGALVSAAIVAGGAFTALAVAGGLLTAAFMSMTDAQRTLLSDAFEPLHQEMIGLGQLMITEMIPYFDTWSTNLQHALLLLIPLATQMGAAFGQAGDIVTASLSGPGFQRLSESLGTWLPSIILKLSNAFGEFLNGVAGSFAAVMPFVDRFAGYLERVATRWSEFTNSDQGQNSITAFVDRGLQSLESLWNFVREFSGFIFDVLFDPASQRAGQTIFDGLADAFAGFRESISSGDLERWFNDAIEFGRDMWSMMQALGGVLESLYQAGVLEAVGDGISTIAVAIEAVNLWLGPFMDGIGTTLPAVMKVALGPLQAISEAILEIGNSTQWVANLFSKIPGAPDMKGVMSGSGPSKWSGNTTNGFESMFNGLTSGVTNYKPPSGAQGQIDWLTNLGKGALDQTSEDRGGYKSNDWVNPYTAWAQSLIDNGPSEIAKVKVAMRKANRAFAQAIREVNLEALETLRSVNEDAVKVIREAAQADSASSVQAALASLVESMVSQTTSSVEQMLSSARASAASLRNTADSTVQAAQSALNSAASSLASATTPEAAAKALADVYRAQAALDEAEKAADRMDAKADRLVARARKRAARMRKRVARAEAIIAAQEVVSASNVASLVGGLGAANATLADYAEARAQVAEKLAAANQKLAEAIQIRDDFRNQITESIKSFGALTTAQAKVVDGVEQALTSLDITSNLEDRLAKIRKFQENLRVLLAMGLSDSAYKQIVSAGVEQGGAFAEALVQGGQGAVGQTNGLVSQIDAVADQLGLDASNRLYQAGVDAAQGLVDGLESLSAELDSAATRLGEAIAAAIARALGIHSPSKVLSDMMEDVGDGAVVGLDNQGPKVGAAARRFSDNIAVSPEVAAWATQQGQAATVSGNGDDPKYDIDLTVITPTEDPVAVAHEAINELTGRLG